MNNAFLTFDCMMIDCMSDEDRTYMRIAREYYQIETVSAGKCGDRDEIMRDDE